ncbi:hypothetical protein ACQR1I_17880 [Bradyrhizobium sp. HKCCYLS2038]|uniref:hypothetical protein n=1 Tax=unclassified Bradyrhizobium TaxID=2631580 RepID=UPI003EBDE559
MSRTVKLVAVRSCCALATVFALNGADPFGLGVAIAAEQLPLAERLQAPNGNPVQDVPLASLSATRDRPIFSPSRRAASAEAPPAVVAAPVAQEPPAPEAPQLTLLGTIVNGADGLAILLDPSSTAPLRIRAGTAYQGWTLRRVEARSVTLQKGQEVMELSLQTSSGQPKIPPGTSLVQVPSTTMSPTPAQAGPPFLSPESRLLKLHHRQRSGRRQL